MQQSYEKLEEEYKKFRVETDVMLWNKNSQITSVVSPFPRHVAAVVERRPSAVLVAAVCAGAGRLGESADAATGAEGADRAADAAGGFAAPGRGGAEAAGGGRPEEAGADEGGVRRVAAEVQRGGEGGGEEGW